MSRYSREEIARLRARGLMPLDAAADILGGLRAERGEIVADLRADSTIDATAKRPHLRRLRRLEQVLAAHFPDKRKLQ